LISTGQPEAHVVGEFGRLQIAEVPAHVTPFVGMQVRETGIRQQTGCSVVGFWERGKLRPAYPQTEVHAGSALVCAGTAPQIAAFNAGLPKREERIPPVLVIGAGRVGWAVIQALKRKGLPVHAIDRTDAVLASLAATAAATLAGDAGSSGPRARRHPRRSVGGPDDKR
jgi:voltage-gated potassium channel